MKQIEHLKKYWAEVRAGIRPKPERKPRTQAITRRKLRCNSRWVRGSEIILTVYPHGELGFREPGQRTEFRLGIVEAHRQSVLITTAKIAARVRELRKQGVRRATAKARKEFLTRQM